LVRVVVEIPDPVFETVELLAFMRGVSVDVVLRDVIVDYASRARDLLDLYYFKLVRVPRVTRELLSSTGVEADVDMVISTMGKLVTVLKDSFGYIPNSLDLDRLSGEELERLSNAIADVEGVRLDPERYISDLLGELRGVARAFSLELVERGGERGGSIRGYRARNVNLLYQYYGFGTRKARQLLSR